MQLDESRPRSVRSKLRSAACLLLTAAAPRMVQAQDPAPSPTPTNQFDLTGLFYSERIRVLEPTIRYTRISPGGRTFSGQFGFDSITGASPRGSLSSGQVQTVTSASGRRRSIAASELPTTEFSDSRFAVDAEVQQPAGPFSFTLGGHFSHESDYESRGVSGKLTVDLNHKLTALTFGGGYNSDTVSPVDGTATGLAPPGRFTGIVDNPKHVTNMLAGISQVVSRRWLVGVTASLSTEDGYLTDPYKILSVINRTTGVPISEVSERRPDTRSRKSVQGDSVYHFTSNVLYLSYRRYWDDWGVKSHTVDGRYRIPYDESLFVEPHLRFYTQSAADFYRYGLIQGESLPSYATSDYRMAAFRSVTLGAAIGFKPSRGTSEWTLRAEYIGQFGDKSPPGAVGVQSTLDLFPTINIFSLALNYRFNR